MLPPSFAEFYRRGTCKVGLNVDAQSLTGAHLLFERSGMHVLSQYRIYEKEVRAGKEEARATARVAPTIHEAGAPAVYSRGRACPHFRRFEFL